MSSSTQFNIKLFGEDDFLDFSESIISSDLDLKLDDFGILNVTCSISREIKKKLDSGNLPKKAEVKIGVEKVFTGYLTEFNILDDFKIMLSYKDIIFNFLKNDCEFFLKNTDLLSVLRKALSDISCDIQHVGSFEDQISSISVSSRTIYSLLQELSFKYGFHFRATTDNSGITLVALDSFLSSRNISRNSHCNILHSFHNINKSISDFTSRYLDRDSIKKNDSYLNLKDALSEHKFSSRSFRSRVNWNSSNGSLNYFSPNREKYKESKKNLLNLHTKEMFGQETIFLELFDTYCYPGDHLTIEKDTLNFHLGDFLIHSAKFDFKSSRPRSVVKGIRL